MRKRRRPTWSGSSIQSAEWKVNLLNNPAQTNLVRIVCPATKRGLRHFAGRHELNCCGKQSVSLSNAQHKIKPRTDLARFVWQVAEVE
jgi:hypothetical protein